MRTLWRSMFVLSLIGLIGLLFSCGENRKNLRQNEHPYKSFSYYYGENEIDSLLTDIVTFIGRKPAQATSATRFETQFRDYYNNLSKNFIPYYYSIDGKLHTFYLSRPSRALDGNRRGVLGTFERNENGKIVNLRELLNTVTGDETRIKMLGEQLMTAYLLNQSFDSVLLNRSIVEWPDSTLKYDTVVFEWRYVSPEIP